MVSIIITVYKKKDTIRKCLESVLNQTYKDLEVILINDDLGETIPYYEDLLKHLQDQYNVITFTNPKNVGAGLSRRKGLELANGDYTNFLDADDYVEKDYIEKLLEIAEKKKADLVSSGYYKVFNSGEKTKVFGKFGKYIKNKIGNHGDFMPYLNSCLVKKELWNNIEYSPERYIEDGPVLFKLIYLSKAMVIIPYCGYNYVQEDSSLCHEASELKTIIFSMISNIEIINFLRDKKDTELVKSFLNAFIVHHRNIQDIKISKEDVEVYATQLALIYQFFVNNFKI